MNVKNLVLGIGIVIVFALALWQGIEAFDHTPQYEDYCKNQNYYYPGSYPIKDIPVGSVNCTLSPTPQQQNECSLQGGNLIASNYDANGCPASYTCDTCTVELTKAQKDHSKRVFYISLIVGVIALIVGYAFLVIEPVGSALMASGVWAFFYGTVVNWQNLTSAWRFLLLLVALTLLVWFALRLNSQKKKGKGFFGFGKKR